MFVLVEQENNEMNQEGSSDDENGGLNKDFDSDDEYKDPNYNSSNSSSSETSSSSSDLETVESVTSTNAENTSRKRKVSFANKTENNAAKKLRRVNKWQKEESKLLRNSGKPYYVVKKVTDADGIVSNKKVRKEGRKLLPPCAENCRYRCTKQFTSEDRLSIFNDYWNMADLQRQRDFIAGHAKSIKHKYRNTECVRRLNVAYYLFCKGRDEDTRVCQKFFSSTLGVSTRVLRTVEDKRNSDTKIISTDFRGKHNNHTKVSDNIKDRIRMHIRSIPRIPSHYCRAQSSREYIDGSKNISELYRDYTETCKKENVEFGNYQMYYTIFTKEFNLASFAPKKDQCELCKRYDVSTGEDKLNLQDQYQQHILEKDLSRREKENDKNNTDSNSVVAVYDLQATLPCPQGDVSTFYYVSKLNLFNFTIYNMKNKHGDCFFWHEGEAGRGANEIGSCVWRFLDRVNQESNDPIDVIFYSDNCGGQNKNKSTIFMYHKAVNYFKNINSITHKYLIVGHTMNEGDNVHACIERAIKNARKSGPIYVPDQFTFLIRNAKKKGTAYSVHEINHEDFYDFSSDTIEISKTETNENFKITQVKILRVEKARPFELLYKYSYGELNFSHLKMTINGQRKKTRKTEVGLKRAYTTKKGIKPSLKNGLINLVRKNVIPKNYAPFYESL